MTMLDAQRRITKTALFSVKRLGEEILYSNKEGTKKIVAIIEIGPDMSRGDWNDAATQIENARMNDIAEISILRSDVPNPKEADTIQYNNETYNVTQIYKYDSAGDNFVLICSKNGRGFGL